MTHRVKKISLQFIVDICNILSPVRMRFICGLHVRDSSYSSQPSCEL